MPRSKPSSKRNLKPRTKAVSEAIVHDHGLLSQFLLTLFFLLLIIDIFLLFARWKMGLM